MMPPYVDCIFLRSFQIFLLFLLFFHLPVSVAFSASVVSYTYDNRHRLVKASYDNGTVIDYSYDNVDNRLSKSIVGPAGINVYEDAEDGNMDGWDVYDSSSTGAIIDNVYDELRQSRVIELTGAATSNGYRLRDETGNYWSNDDNKVMEWSMRYSENFTVYIAVQTSDGFRYIYYAPSDTDNLGDSTYIHHGLGSYTKDDGWHTIIRDLEYDLKEAQPNNELIEILGFLIRGSGKVDNIKTHEVIPDTQDSDGDTISDNDEISLYGTHPYYADTDGDGLFDGEELTYWGTDWNSDPDGDGLINILDIDADGDSVVDGVEISQGTDPSDVNSYPVSIVYEDAEDGNMDGWDVYESSSKGAIIDNVYDELRQSRVIELTGAATSNGYRLRDETGNYWSNDDNKVMEWSLRYSENFIVYIAVQTSDGFRYIYYTPSDTDNLGDSTYIHHGLGSYTKDDGWHTIIRDLEYDLKEAQPNNELIEVLGFLIRGSGKVDDIKTHEVIPDTQDSDGDTISDNDEISLYGTHPYYADTDGDGLFDGEELTYWGTDWNSDPDGDGLINILDIDADGDSVVDGVEISQGTDPSDVNSYPVSIVYEDAEDGNMDGWDVYESSSTGAIIDNVYDELRQSRVIELTGAATSNGYRLRDETGNYWSNDDNKVMEWSLRYSENFIVYIAVQTSDGFRYIYYTPSDTDNLGDSTYIHHGLGSYTKDDGWHTIIRDLEYDLNEAQPNNELIEVLGFLIRGSGKVDDIKTHEVIPDTP